MARCAPFDDDRAAMALRMIRELVEYHAPSTAQGERDLDKTARVVAVNDHKGMLVVYWEKEPSEAEMQIAADVWELFYEPLISHFVLKYVAGEDPGHHDGIDGRATRSSS